MLMINDFFLNSNETELKEKSASSSSFKTVIILDNKKLLDEQTEDSFKLDNLMRELISKLVTELKYFSLDDSEITNAEKLALDIEKSYSVRVLGEVLQNIYIQYNDYCNMLIGICRIIGRFELKEVMPWGPTMLMGLLSHKSEAVKEYAVSVVENWSDVELEMLYRIVILKQMY